MFDNIDKAMGCAVLFGILITYAIWFGVEGYDNTSLIFYICALQSAVWGARFLIKRNNV